MLTTNSILRRLPPGLDQKQVVYLEGIRHCAEIVWLAYCRLEKALTMLVDKPGDASPEADDYTEAFMDAWTVVDAIDRFRQLWSMFPGMQFADCTVTRPSFADISQEVRGLRNVTDHIAQRADHISASGNPVLGLLTWLTISATSPDQAYSCLLAPGTTKKTSWTAVNPAGKEFTSYATGRTGLIHLAAGEHRSNLTAVIPEIRERVNRLEHALEAELIKHGLKDKQAGGDIFIRLQLTYNRSQGDAQHRIGD